MRRPIPKKTRFDVFKRDGFACQYCGADPSTTTLEIDHIHPIAEGGGDEIDNLITACFACNRGKGATPLEVIPQSLGEKAAEIAEREEQIRGYYAVLEEKKARVEADIDAVDRVFSAFTPGYELAPRSRLSVRKFIEELGAPTVIEAMETAASRPDVRNDRLFRYFCGICWNKIRERS